MRTFGIVLSLSLILVMLVSGSQLYAFSLDTFQFMSEREFDEAGLNKLTDAELESLNQWFNTFVLFVLSSVDDQNAAERDTVPLHQLDGNADVYAEDGQYLGRISSSSVLPDSIANSVGIHGSGVSTTSVFNRVSKYGGTSGIYSPFNRVTSTPPKIILSGDFVAYLTANSSLSPRIDPYKLFEHIGVSSNLLP